MCREKTKFKPLKKGSLDKPEADAQSSSYPFYHWIYKFSEAVE